MIVVKNTKELEELYDINQISDDEQVTVLGGMAGKEKYNSPKYMQRLTYSGRQIKQIVAKMHEIESAIPESWSEWQKSKYIYQVLGKKISYCYDYMETTNNPSNLTILLNGEGICAGYSLLYKEMMDRQGIQCEYVRGQALDRNGNSIGKHAWNVLVIDGQAPVQVDLTWDSERMQKGYESYRFFGNSDFQYEHYAEEDERRFSQYVYLSPDQINSVDIEGRNTEDMKAVSINNAIDQTYKKYSQIYGKEKARTMVKTGIQSYIARGELLGFTREGNGRQGIQANVSQKDMIDQLISFYVGNFELPKREMNYLEFAVAQNLYKYGSEQVTIAIENYITQNNPSGFTRTNNAREYIQQVSQEEIIGLLADKMLDSRIQSIEAELDAQNNIAAKSSFSYGEFPQVQLPEKEKKNMIKNAFEFIKRRTKEKQQNAQIYTREENVNSIEKGYDEK